MIITKEMIISGFASKVINDCSDIFKNKIKDADKNRKPNEENIEIKIYQVLVEALNGFFYNEYQEEEMVYDAAENILKQFKDGKNDYNEAVKKGLNIVIPEVTDDIVKSFLEVLCYEICKDKNDILYKEIMLIQGEQIIYQQQQTNRYVKEGIRESRKNEKKILEGIDDLKGNIHCLGKEANSQENSKQNHDNRVVIKNRAERYAKKWDEDVFLNHFNERDEDKKKNVKLKEIYLEEYLPHYIWKENKNPESDLKKVLYEYIIDNNDKKMLLILGQPGIGKSTLITWIMANLAERKDHFLVYRFTDLKDINWQGNNILHAIFERINYDTNELENKVLILDGFDEIHVGSDRVKVLNQLFNKMIEMDNLKRFSLIITCRENYVHYLGRIVCDYITLQAWDRDQIQGFYKTYVNVSEGEVDKSTFHKILENNEIFGIPLILYMVLALNIIIDEKGSIIDAYDQIFSLDSGGIYDRCIKNTPYGMPHRISETEIRKQIHQVSQEIAFWIFENNSEYATISRLEYEKICDIVVKKLESKDEIENKGKNEDMLSKEVQSNVLIGNYFKLVSHCDGVGTDELQFVHRSIYEYFVVVYFFESLHKLRSKKDIAGKLGELFKQGHLTMQMLAFIKYKFNSIKQCSVADIIKEVFDIMLQDGMTYHAEGKNDYKNIIIKEMNIFSNMLSVMHLWHDRLEKIDNKIIIYLRHNHLVELNLSGVDLKGMDLSASNLSGSDLRKADLYKANLNRIDLEKADLQEANLREAKLIRANMRGANLRGANLREADLQGVDLGGANLKGADLVGADLREADVSEVDLKEVDLREVDLSKTNLSGKDLQEANLSGADLMEVDLSAVDLRGANLIGVNLREADLTGADLSETDLTGAYLRGADLRLADLREADLSGADLVEADLSETDLSEAILNEAIFDEEQVDILNRKYDLSKSRIILSEMDQVISYQEYCIRK